MQLHGYVLKSALSQVKTSYYLAASLTKSVFRTSCVLGSAYGPYLYEVLSCRSRAHISLFDHHFPASPLHRDTSRLRLGF